MIINVMAVRAQTPPSYAASHFAASGDTFYFSQVLPTNLPAFNQTGEDVEWDFSDLGTVQRQQMLLFRNPNQAGYSILTFPYLYFGQVNLNSTGADTLNLANFFTLTNINDFYRRETAALRQRASSFSINISGLPINVNNVFSNEDVIYRFPFTYQDADSSVSTYGTNSPIPGIYYISRWQKRVNRVEAWGQLETPYGSFTCLKMRTDIARYDSLSVSGTGLPADTLYFREYRWFSTAHKQPVLIITQARIGGDYVTQSVQYLDDKLCLDPSAFFAYFPLSPRVGDEVQFQNLSLNGTGYTWDFGDGSDPSSQLNPRHTYAAAGNYTVTLTVRNCSLNTTFSLPITVAAPASRTVDSAPADLAQMANPVQGHRLEMRLHQPTHLRLTDMLGRVVYTQHLSAGHAIVNIPTSLHGNYILSLHSEGGNVQQRKIWIP